MNRDRTERKGVKQRTCVVAVNSETIAETTIPMISKTAETKTTFVRTDAAGNKVKDETATVLAKTNYEVPGSDADGVTDAANDAAFLAWLATNPTIIVSGTAFGQEGGPDKEIPPTAINNYNAWEYGVSLLANAIGRKAADLAKPITDHKISTGKGGAVTDLDAMTDADLVRTLNKLFSVMDTVDFGPVNTAKINDKAKLALDAGTLHKDNNGDFVIGPAKNGGKGKSK